MAGQTEARHVGGGMYLGGHHGTPAGGIQLHHGFNHRAHGRLVYLVDLQRRAHDARAQGLGKVQHVARLGALVAHDARWVHRAENGKAVLGFVVVDGVPAGNECAGLRHGIGAALQDGGGNLGSQVYVQCQQVQGNVRFCPHGEHVGKRVGRCHAPELVRVVHYGGEEVHGKHAGNVLAYLPYCAVVAGFVSEQQTIIRRRGADGGKGREYFLEVARTPLGCSTAFRRELREPYVLFLLAHQSPLSAGLQYISNGERILIHEAAKSKP